eukprot:GEMP01041891.1.p1 GENE.GEMP01041891.1~~GEMP01041891.1.p1  ORF type:complete len:454 (+),score=94.19 GEMP01041891.1:28-1389(+)
MSGAVDFGPGGPENFGILRDRLVKPYGSIETPRRDAKKFRLREHLATPCECIVEMYELLWRWATLAGACGNFPRRFGFALPQTVIISNGKPYAWYFMSQKDGALLRKKHDNLSRGIIERDFLKKTGNQEIVAQWIPMASQFADDKSASSSVEFLCRSQFTHFLSKLFQFHSGILQEFVYPPGISNSLIRTMEYQDKISVSVRYNRHLLHSTVPLFKRCATYEGWPGLSSVQYRYNPAVSANSKYHGEDMDKKLRDIARVLNERVRQESVRQMHFLESNQYIAFHFKLDQSFIPQFLFASIVREEEAFLQSQSQLVLEDPVMKSPVSWRASPIEILAERERCADIEGRSEVDVGDDGGRHDDEDALEEEHANELTRALDEDFDYVLPRPPRRKRDRIQDVPSFLPKTEFQMPTVPPVPYNANLVPHFNEEAARFEYPPPFITPGSIKQPLVTWG